MCVIYLWCRAKIVEAGEACVFSALDKRKIIDTVFFLSEDWRRKGQLSELNPSQSVFSSWFFFFFFSYDVGKFVRLDLDDRYITTWFGNSK